MPMDASTRWRLSGYEILSEVDLAELVRKAGALSIAVGTRRTEP